MDKHLDMVKKDEVDVGINHCEGSATEIVKENPEGPESYPWGVVLAGVLGLLASLGLGRFALGTMLPSMGEALNLSYSQMGVIGTVNFCGYLGAVLFCGVLTTRFGSSLVISTALLLVGVSMILVGFSSHYAIILVLYFLTGIGSALSNVPIMGLIPRWFHVGNRGRIAGIFVMGNGIGIILAGKAVPALTLTTHGWRMSWVVLGGLVLLIAVICFRLLRNKQTVLPRQGFVSTGTGSVLRESKSEVATPTAPGIFYHCGAIYFLFGSTYVIYITFFVTFLVQDYGLTEQAAGSLWAWVGLLSLGSGPIFGYLSDRYGRKFGLVTVFSIQTVAYVLAAFQLPIVCVYLSLFCFGLVVFSIPTIMAALVGDYAGPERASAMFGFVTFVFGIGQVTGPFIAGMLAERTGTFSTSFMLAAVLATVAIILSLLLPGKDNKILSPKVLNPAKK